MRQRRAAAALYLSQLLFHHASVLQCDRLLFGALCCQHLARRTKHVAERVSGEYWDAKCRYKWGE